MLTYQARVLTSAAFAALLSPSLALLGGIGLGLYALAVLLASFTIGFRKRDPKLAGPNGR